MGSSNQYKSGKTYYKMWTSVKRALTSLWRYFRKIDWMSFHNFLFSWCKHYFLRFINQQTDYTIIWAKKKNCVTRHDCQSSINGSQIISTQSGPSLLTSSWVVRKVISDLDSRFSRIHCLEKFCLHLRWVVSYTWLIASFLWSVWLRSPILH